MKKILEQINKINNNNMIFIYELKKKSNMVRWLILLEVFLVLGELMVKKVASSTDRFRFE